MAFGFAKPAGFTYRAGRSVYLMLLDPPETDAKAALAPLHWPARRMNRN